MPDPTDLDTAFPADPIAQDGGTITAVNTVTDTNPSDVEGLNADQIFANWLWGHRNLLAYIPFFAGNEQMVGNFFAAHGLS